MPLLALAIALLLAGPVYGGDCSGTGPNDLCEAGRPAPTSSGLTRTFSSKASVWIFSE